MASEKDPPPPYNSYGNETGPGYASQTPYPSQPVYSGHPGQPNSAAFVGQPQTTQQVIVVSNSSQGYPCPQCHQGSVEKTWTPMHICLLMVLCFLGGIWALITVFTVPRKCRNCGWTEQKFTKICLGISLVFLALWIIGIILYVVLVVVANANNY